MTKELLDIQRKFLSYLHWKSKQPMTPQDIDALPESEVQNT